MQFEGNGGKETERDPVEEQISAKTTGVIAHGIKTKDG